MLRPGVNVPCQWAEKKPANLAERASWMLSRLARRQSVLAATCSAQAQQSETEQRQRRWLRYRIHDLIADHQVVGFECQRRGIEAERGELLGCGEKQVDLDIRAIRILAIRNTVELLDQLRASNRLQDRASSVIERDVVERVDRAVVQAEIVQAGVGAFLRQQRSVIEIHLRAVAAAICIRTVDEVRAVARSRRKYCAAEPGCGGCRRRSPPRCPLLIKATRSA